MREPQTIHDTVVQSAAVHPDWGIRQHLEYLLAETGHPENDVAQLAPSLPRWITEGREMRRRLETAGNAGAAVPVDRDSARVIAEIIRLLRQRYGWARRDQAQARKDTVQQVNAARADAYAQAMEVVREVATRHAVALPPDGRERD